MPALLSQYLKPQWTRVTLLVIFMFVWTGIDVLNPQIIRYFIDTAEAGGTTRSLVIAVLCVLRNRIPRTGADVSQHLFRAGHWLASHKLDAR